MGGTLMEQKGASQVGQNPYGDGYAAERIAHSMLAQEVRVPWHVRTCRV